MRREESGVLPVWCPFYREDSGKSIFCEGITDESFLRLTFVSARAKRQQMEIFCRSTAKSASSMGRSTRGMRMREEKGARKRADPIGKASGNLEKALETMSRRLLTQIKEGETPGKELGELAKVMKQAVEIRQELQGEGAGQERGVRVVFAGQAEEFSE